MSGMLGAYFASIGAALVSLSVIGSSFGSTQVAVSATATLQLDADGDIMETTDTLGTQDVGNWVNPKTAAGANYECRLTVNSGSVSSGSTGSWLSLGSNRGWSQSQIGDGLQTANVTLEIRSVASGVVLDSQTFDFFAEVG